MSQNACSLLGYGKGELDGKNVNSIMPPPFSQRHNRYIRQYIQTGRERVISSVNTVVALHKVRLRRVTSGRRNAHVPANTCVPCVRIRELGMSGEGMS